MPRREVKLTSRDRLSASWQHSVAQKAAPRRELTNLRLASMLTEVSRATLPVSWSNGGRLPVFGF